MTPLLLHQGVAAYGPISIVSALIVAVVVAALVGVAFFAPLSRDDAAEPARPRKRRSGKVTRNRPVRRLAP